MAYDTTTQTRPEALSRARETPRRVLLNTADSFDAGVLGFDGPADPSEDGEGLKLAEQNGWFILNGPDGELVLHEQAARIMAQDILDCIRLTGSKSGRDGVAKWLEAKAATAARAAAIARPSLVIGQVKG